MLIFLNFSQLDVVIAILKKLLNAPIESQPAIVCEQIEGNRNIFHVSVQNAYSRTNADHADVDATDSRLSTASQKLTLLRRKLLRHGFFGFFCFCIFINYFLVMNANGKK